MRLERKYLAHYIDANINQPITNYVRLGNYLEEYIEELSPQIGVQRNLRGKPNISFNGYAVESEVGTYYAEAGDPLFDVIEKIANNRLTNDWCKTTKVDVLVDEEGNQLWAYREIAWLIPQSVGGDTSGVQIPFKIYCGGERVKGTFNARTKMFVPDGGQEVPVQELLVTENGVYSLPFGRAYNPVTVSVPQALSDDYLKVIDRTISGTYVDVWISTIGPNAFNGCSQLEGVDFSRCASVQQMAFAECVSLKSVNLPNCVSIGKSAFESCAGLSYVEFSNCEYVNSNAFHDCSGLISASFPKCSVVGASAFGSCGNLTNINFPKCGSVGAGAFERCGFTYFDFSMCVSIGSNAFYNCDQLEGFSLPMCQRTSQNAFTDCDNLQEAVLPELTNLNYYVFQNCVNLSKAELPKCTTIGYSAFAGCYNLTSVSASECKTLSTGCFMMCSSLSVVSFPKVTNIYAMAFSSCHNLISLYLMGGTRASLSNTNVFSSTPIGGYSAVAGVYGSIYVPASLLATYQSATNWAVFSERMVGV